MRIDIFLIRRLLERRACDTGLATTSICGHRLCFLTKDPHIWLNGNLIVPVGLSAANGYIRQGTLQKCGLMLVHISVFDI